MSHTCAVNDILLVHVGIIISILSDTFQLGMAMGIGLDVVFPVVKHHILPLIKPLLKAQNQTHVYPALLQAVDVIRCAYSRISHNIHIFPLKKPSNLEF